MTQDQFAEKIKQKYPEYADMDNGELTQKILNKYPQYESQIDGFDQQPVNSKNIFQKFTDTIGLGGAVDVFSSHLARAGVNTDTTPVIAQKFIDRPTEAQTLGAVGQVGSVAASGLMTGGTSLMGQMAVGGGR